MTLADAYALVEQHHNDGQGMVFMPGEDPGEYYVWYYDRTSIARTRFAIRHQAMWTSTLPQEEVVLAIKFLFEEEMRYTTERRNAACGIFTFPKKEEDNDN